MSHGSVRSSRIDDCLVPILRLADRRDRQGFCGLGFAAPIRLFQLLQAAGMHTRIGRSNCHVGSQHFYGPGKAVLKASLLWETSYALRSALGANFSCQGSASSVRREKTRNMTFGGVSGWHLLDLQCPEHAYS